MKNTLKNDLLRSLNPPNIHTKIRQIEPLDDPQYSSFHNKSTDENHNAIQRYRQRSEMVNNDQNQGNIHNSVQRERNMSLYSPGMST